MFQKGHTINKGRTPWNKGKKGYSAKSGVARYGSDNPNWKGGIATIGNCLDCGIKLKSYPSKYCRPCCYKHRTHKDNSGKNHYGWKGGRPRCQVCNKEIVHKAKRCSSCAKLGEANPAWNGGASLHGYPSEFNEALRSKIRGRDEHKCAICGYLEKEIQLAVHHIDYDKNNCKLENLISLCHSCHSKTNYKRETWLEFFRHV